MLSAEFVQRVVGVNILSVIKLQSLWPNKNRKKHTSAKISFSIPHASIYTILLTIKACTMNSLHYCTSFMKISKEYLPAINTKVRINVHFMLFFFFFFKFPNSVIWKHLFALNVFRMVGQISLNRYIDYYFGVLTFTTLWTKPADDRRQIGDIFSRKQDLTLHANCLHWRQFAWNFKTCFLGKIRKIFQLSENFPRMLSVNS